MDEAKDTDLFELLTIEFNNVNAPSTDKIKFEVFSDR